MFVAALAMSSADNTTKFKKIHCGYFLTHLVTVKGAGTYS
jgi:hypothetical protein